MTNLIDLVLAAKARFVAIQAELDGTFEPQEHQSDDDVSHVEKAWRLARRAEVEIGEGMEKATQRLAEIAAAAETPTPPMTPLAGLACEEHRAAILAAIRIETSAEGSGDPHLEGTWLWQEVEYGDAWQNGYKDEASATEGAWRYVLTEATKQLEKGESFQNMTAQEQVERILSAFSLSLADECPDLAAALGAQTEECALNQSEGAFFQVIVSASEDADLDGEDHEIPGTYDFKLKYDCPDMTVGQIANVVLESFHESTSIRNDTLDIMVVDRDGNEIEAQSTDETSSADLQRLVCYLGKSSGFDDKPSGMRPSN